MCLSPIPAAKKLLVFAGLNSLLPCDHWHLSTALSAAWTRQLIQFMQGHMSFAMCSFFPLLAPCSKVRAYRHDTHGWNLLWKGTIAMFLSSPMEFVLVCLLAYLGLTLRRVPRPLTSNCETALAAARKACFHPRPGVYPMSGIICSQGGHRIAGQMAKAFSSA